MFGVRNTSAPTGLSDTGERKGRETAGRRTAATGRSGREPEGRTAATGGSGHQSRRRLAENEHPEVVRLFVKLGPCRARCETEEQNPLPPNLVEVDPRLTTRIVYCERPPSHKLLDDTELEPLPPVEHDRCDRHGEPLIVTDRTPPAQDLCRHEESGHIVEHVVSIKFERDEWNREVVRLRSAPRHNFELHAMTGEGPKRIQ